MEFSSQQSTGADHAAANFIDGSGNTTWHTLFNATDDGKFYTVKLDGVRYLSKLAYLPGGQNGRLKSGEIYVSLDGKDWTLAHTFQGLENNDQRKEIVLDTPTQALYVKVVATETYYNTAGEMNKYFNGKMLDFYVDATQSYDAQAQVTYTTQAPTNQNVTATLVLPQGCQAEETEYVFEDNGTHIFTYTDANGQEQSVEAVVTWIDREAPKGELVYDLEGWTSQPVTATLENLSEDVAFVDGSNGVYVFDTNHSYDFVIRDAAGNETTYTATVAWIDPTKPQDDQLVSVADGQGETTLTLNIDPDYVQVLAVNGEAASGNVFTVMENGTYTFQMMLKETGYTFQHTVVVDWLSSEPQVTPTPTPEATPSPEVTPEPEQTPVPESTPDPEQPQPAPAPDGSTGSTGAGSAATGGTDSSTPAPRPQQAPDAEGGEQAQQEESQKDEAQEDVTEQSPSPTPAPEQGQAQPNPATPLVVAGAGVVVCVAAAVLWLLRRRTK